MWQVMQRSEFSLGLAWNEKISLVPAISLAVVARRILFGIRMGFAGAVAGLTSCNAGGRRRGHGHCPRRPLSLSASVR